MTLRRTVSIMIFTISTGFGASACKGGDPLPLRDVERETASPPDAATPSDVDGDTLTPPGDLSGPDLAPGDADPPLDLDVGDARAEATGDVAAADTTSPADATPDDAPIGTDVEADVSAPSPTDLSDSIFGAEVPRESSWWVHEGRIYRGRQVVRLRGINWFGLETADRALHGTWFGRKVEDILAEVRALGFDSLRIPVSPQTINPGFAVSSWALNAYQSGQAPTGREQLERLLVAAADAGFTVLLDFHTCHPDYLGQNLPGRPDGCEGYTNEDWKSDLAKLATLAIPHAHVLGVDLVNEPYKLTWSQWRALAAQGAEAVLRANPRVLVFVEGVGGLSYYGSYYPFWGGNLTEAASSPPQIPESRLVFSPHVYGPGISDQQYFSASNFPANMPAVWDSQFGHLVPRYAFAPGEFGGFYDDTRKAGEVAWNEAFVAYLATLDRGGPTSFYYWALNANSGDTGGLYEDDWTTVVMRRVALLAPLLAP